MAGAQERVTQLLSELQSGRPEAAKALFEVLYEELHDIASRLFRSQRGAHTLQPTALVNEAYLKFASTDPSSGFNDRAHFCNAAARAMRQILVNHARDAGAIKRGGGQERERVTLSAVPLQFAANDIELLALDEALERLAELDERQAKIAELRIFAGLGSSEIAQLLDMPLRTVQLDWKMARIWLSRLLDPNTDESHP